MTPDLQLPLGVDVPDGWQPVNPVEAGAPGAVLVAVLPTPGDEFSPNITVGIGTPSEDADVQDAADAAVTRITGVVDELVVRDRETVGSPVAPAVTQVLDLIVAGLRLVQSQVHLALPLPGESRRIVAELVCTCTPSQADRVIPDFQRFVSSFHLREDEVGN